MTIDDLSNKMRTAENSVDLTRMVYRAIDRVLKEKNPNVSPYSTSVGVHLQLRRFDEHAELWWNIECPGALEILRRISPVFERASGGRGNSSGVVKHPYGVHFEKTISPFVAEPEYDHVHPQTIVALNQATTLESWFEGLMDALPSWYALQRGMPLNEPALNTYRSATEALKRVHLPQWVERTQLWKGIPMFPNRSYGAANERVVDSLASILLESCPLIEIHRAVGFVELRGVPIQTYSHTIQERCKPFVQAYALLHDRGIPSWAMKEALAEPSVSLDESSLVYSTNDSI